MELKAKVFKSFVIAILLLSNTLIAQDQDYTQFFNTQVFLNPAAVGSESVPRAIIGYRNQWSSLVGNMTGFTGAIDGYLPRIKSGVGLLFNSGQAGVGGLYSTDLMAVYSYRIKMKNDWNMSFGLQAGYVFRGGSYYQYTFGDQLMLSGDVKGSTAENINPVANLNYFDFGGGILLFKEGTHIGISGYHFSRPNQSLFGEVDRLPIKLNLVLSHSFILSYSHTRTQESYIAITPMAYFRWQGPFKQISLGAIYDYTPVQFGLFYRGLPFLTQNGVANSDAISAYAGIKYKGFLFGYSYDITVSGLTNRSGGSHEFQIGYILESQKPFKPKRSRFKKK